VRSWGLALLIAGILALPGHARAATEPVPVVVQSAPGQFEIAAVDGAVAHAVAGVAQEGWRLLAAPLGLPDAFPSPVFVRLVSSSSEAGDLAPFRVAVEAGGIVSVQVRPDGVVSPNLQRALVQGLLLRLAVARYGARERLAVPLWLEHGCVGWWRSRSDAAQLDALKYETSRLPPPALADLLAWRRGGDEPRAWTIAAVWLLSFFQAESGRAHEWPQFLERLLGADDPEAALASCYPGRFGSAEERELWWQTGWHYARRVRTLPTLEAAESRAQLEALARFVFASADVENDAVVSLPQVLAHAGEPILAAEITRRASELTRIIPALHPFYRNAGLSLSDAFAGASNKSAARRQSLGAAFERDWREATELERATSAALDAVESRTR
jgi:hypothetical protein